VIINTIVQNNGNDQEIKYQDIKIDILQEIKIMIRRLKFSFFIISKVLKSIEHFSGDQKFLKHYLDF
jgi:hypothetical protein